MLRELEDDAEGLQRIVFVQTWLQEIKARVPAP